MLIPAVPSTVRYTFTGLNTYPAPFPFYDLESVKVQFSNNDISNLILEDLIYSIDYIVVGELDSGDDSLEAYKYGTITITADGLAKLVNGYTLAVYRDTSIEQLFQYNELDNFPAKSHENALGRLTVEVQEVSSKLERALVLDPSSTQNPSDVLLEIVVAKDTAVTAAGNALASEQAAESSALTAASNAATSASYTDLARQWASNPVNIPVTGTLNGYSAYHWAQQAEQIAIGDIPDATPTTRGVVPLGGVPNQALQVDLTGTSYQWKE